MSQNDIAAAMERMERVLQRRPESGVHDDAAATARWQGGTRVAASHASGHRVVSDMPAEFGGSGDQASPGWYFRAGVASCLATTISLHAARAGIALTELEVVASSRSDSRGLLGLNAPDGTPVGAAPLGLRLDVRIAADGVPAERLRALVDESERCAPISSAVRGAVPLTLHVATAPTGADADAGTG